MHGFKRLPIVILPFILFLTFCMQEPGNQSDKKEYAWIEIDTYQGTKNYPLVLDSSQKDEFVEIPRGHTLVWHWGNGDRSIEIYDRETGIERYHVYGDANSKLHSAFVIDSEKMIMILDYVFPGGSVYELYDFLNDRVIELSPYRGFIYYFGENKLLYCSFQDDTEREFKWYIINPLTKETWENELTQVLSEKQIFFYPHNQIGTYHGRTVNMNLKKGMIIGEVEDDDAWDGEPDYFVVYWDGEGENVRVLPIKEQLAGERQYIDEIEISPDGNWMKWQEYPGDYDSDRIALYLHHLSEDYPEGISEPIFCGIFSEDLDGTFLIHPELGSCYCLYDYDMEDKIFIYPLKELEEKIATGIFFKPDLFDITALMEISEENPLSLAGLGNRLCFLSEGRRKLYVFEVTDYRNMEASGFSMNLNKPVSAFSIAPSGEYLAVAFKDGEFMLYVIGNNTLIKDKEWHLNRPALVVEFSRDGSYIFTGCENILIQWDCDGNLIQEYRGHSAPVSEIGIACDMELIASADKEKTVVIWNAEGEMLATLNLSHLTFDLKFSEETDKLICGRGVSDPEYIEIDGKKIRLVGSDKENNWFFPEKEMFVSYSKSDKNYYIQTLDGEVAAGLLFYPCIVTEGHWEETIVSWLKEERLKTVVYPVDSGSEITCLTVTADGRIITGHADGTISFRNSKGITERIIKAHDSSINHLVSSSNLVASSGWDKKVVVFKSNGDYLNILTGFYGDIHDLSFTAAGEIIIFTYHTVEKRDIQGRIIFHYPTDGLVRAVNREGTAAVIQEGNQIYLMDLINLKKTDLSGMDADAYILGGDISQNGDILLVRDNAGIDLFYPDGKRKGELETNIFIDPIMPYAKSAIYSPTGNIIAVLTYNYRFVGEKYISFYSVTVTSPEGREMFHCRHYDIGTYNYVTSIPMCFSHSEEALVTAFGSEIYIWDLSDTVIDSVNRVDDILIPQEEMQGKWKDTEPVFEYKDTEAVESVSFSSEYAVIGESYCGNQVKILELFTFNEVRKLDLFNQNVAITTNSRYVLLSDYDGYLRKYNVETGNPIWEKRIFQERICLLALSGDDRYIAACSGFNINELEIVVLDSITGNPLFNITDFDTFQKDVSLNSLKFSKDSRYFAFAGINDGEKLCLWDLNGKKINEFVCEGSITNFEFSYNNRYLITAHRQGSSFLSTLTMWNLDAKEEVWSFRNIDAIINCITVSYDDRLIFTGDTEDTILLFSFESGNLLYSGRRHDNELVNLYIPEGGEYLVSCDKDGQIYIWCIEDFIW